MAARGRRGTGCGYRSASTREGQPVELDIKESAQGGMGPHGLCIGATGSGKSELLRTLVLGLALAQSSEVLNFVLVDFKGGATFLGLDSLNHVSAVITNLEDELPLVDRMYDALHGEMVRRQELLRAAGNYASLRDYERDRERGVKLTPLPTLFVVLDEFSELLSAKPDFIDLFVMIGRLGRSLGVHLLLASQRLEEGKLRGLDTHLSYRVGLRTFSAMESRVVLGVPDAYELPSQPGNGYLKFDTTGMTRFKAAYVSGPVSGDAKTIEQRSRVRHQIVPYSASYIAPQIIEDPAPEQPQQERRAQEPRTACSTSSSGSSRARGRPHTRSGCRRWTFRRPSMSCCPSFPSPPSTASPPPAGSGAGGCTPSRASWTGRSTSAAIHCGWTCRARRAISARSGHRRAASRRCCAA